MISIPECRNSINSHTPWQKKDAQVAPVHLDKQKTARAGGLSIFLSS
jgi:hypothetical protein